MAQPKIKNRLKKLNYLQNRDGFDRLSESERKKQVEFYRVWLSVGRIVAHELGHEAMRFAGNRLLGDFFASLSEAEYLKRNNPKLYNIYLQEKRFNFYLPGASHSKGHQMAIRVMKAFPNQKDRSRVVKELILKKTMEEANEYLQRLRVP